MKLLTDIENELQNFCPELHPYAAYSQGGIRIRCTWGIEYIVDPQAPIEHAKQEMLGHLYEHIGKLTVLVRKFEDNL